MIVFFYLQIIFLSELFSVSLVHFIMILKINFIACLQIFKNCIWLRHNFINKIYIYMTDLNTFFYFLDHKLREDKKINLFDSVRHA